MDFAGFHSSASCWCHDKSHKMDVDLEVESTDDNCTPSSLEQPLKKKLVRHKYIIRTIVMKWE